MSHSALDRPTPAILGTAGRFPRISAVTAAAFLAFSGILVRVSGTSPTTAAFFRGLYALPLLALAAWVESRRLGARPWVERRWTFLAGVFLAVDLVFFHAAVLLVGAGLGTVLANIQVLIVGLVAWILLGERPSRALVLALPVALCGAVLISGVLDRGAYGSDPLLGAAFGLTAAATYSGYLLLIRKGRDPTRIAGPIFDSTITMTLVAGAIGVALGELNAVPSWPAHGWLITLALSAQVAGGLLVAVALPRLPAVTTSLLLLIQPVAAVLLAMVLLAEHPSALQLVGVALVILGVGIGSVPVGSLLGRKASS